MKSTALAVTLACSATCLPSAAAAEPVQSDVQIVDELIAHVYRSLAIRQGFNVLSAPDEGAARIGSVYYVTEPSCESSFITMAKDGTPTKLFLALDLPDAENYKRAPITNWTSVRLSKVAGKTASLELGAKMPQWQADISAALTALEKSNAQMFFATRQFSSVRIKQAMDAALKEEGVTNANALGIQASGAIAPHAELIVQKFEFNRAAIKGRKAGVLLKFMELFGARVSAGQEAAGSSAFQQATFSTAAFKPVATLFNNCNANTTANSE